MLTHGVFGVVPRLRRSLPRCAKRGNVSFPAGPRPSCARERTKRPPTKPIASRRRIRPPKLPAHSKPRRGDTTSARIHIVNTQERTRASGLPAPSEPRRGGTTPRTPGVSPGTSLTQKQIRASERRHNLPAAYPRFRYAARGRLLLSLKKKSVPAGKPCGDASFRRAFFRTRRRADFRCRRCADARRSCPAADRARDGSGDCLRGIRGRRCRRGFLSARRRPDR